MKNVEDDSSIINYIYKLIRYIELIENNDRVRFEYSKTNERYTIHISIPYEQKDTFFLRYKNLISLESHILWSYTCRFKIFNYHIVSEYNFN